MNDEWRQIGKKLEDHHSLFYKFWQLGKPLFTDSIDTAAVVFDKDGKCINFLFNEKFWNECDDYKKLFVISHECLHVILNHGSRFKDTKEKRLANIAQDIVINHLLVENFGFIQDQIQGWENYCWVDTVFKDKKIFGRSFPKDESSEFYFVQLLKTKEESNKEPNSKGSGGQGKSGQDTDDKSDDGSSSDGNQNEIDNLPSTVDDHNKSFNEPTDDLIKDILGDLSNEEIESLSEKLQSTINKDAKAGSMPLCAPFLVKRPSVIIKKKKWESVIKKWEKLAIVNQDTEIEQWIRLPRRFSCVETDLFIPCEESVEEICKKKDKIDVYFFLDTSGSCFHLAERFFAAALTLDPKKFNIRLFCFDTKVVETDLKGQQLFGGGGTSFSVIERHIKSIVASGSKYPQAVFIITDGMGDNVAPAFPKRWHWFLTEKYTKCIPTGSHIYMLSDYE
jgi:hypothetical protein